MDEANTMAERDLGSTFLLPHTHLYKPDRVSIIIRIQSFSLIVPPFFIGFVDKHFFLLLSRVAIYQDSIRCN